MKENKKFHSPTGFTAERAEGHDKLLPRLMEGLAERGYKPDLIEWSGYDPDIRIYDHTIRREAFVDLMVPTQQGLAMSIPKLRHCWKMWKDRKTLAGSIYFVWGYDLIEIEHWQVDNPFTFFDRMVGGPRKPASGHTTEWFLATPSDIFFKDAFPGLK